MLIESKYRLYQISKRGLYANKTLETQEYMYIRIYTYTNIYIYAYMKNYKICQILASQKLLS